MFNWNVAVGYEQNRSTFNFFRGASIIERKQTYTRPLKDGLFSDPVSVLYYRHQYFPRAQPFPNLFCVILLHESN